MVVDGGRSVAYPLQPDQLIGSIQPHGILLIADARTRVVVGEAGPVSQILGMNTAIGDRLDDLLTSELIEHLVGVRHDRATLIGRFHTAGAQFDVASYLSEGYIVVELTQFDGSEINALCILSKIEEATLSLSRVSSIQALSDLACNVFKDLIGFDRILIYRFLDSQSCLVIGESAQDGGTSLLNHHVASIGLRESFECLYRQNRSAVVPNVNYDPVAIRGEGIPSTLDLSHSALRCATSVQLAFWKTMGIAASVSFPIFKAGELWGFISCHNFLPKTVPYEIRVAGQTMANVIGHQITTADEAELNRDRSRLRTQEDRIVSLLEPISNIEINFGDVGEKFKKLMMADGFAVVRGKSCTSNGQVLHEPDLLRLAELLAGVTMETPFATSNLSNRIPEVAGSADKVSGLLAVQICVDEPIFLMWFRAPQNGAINWYGGEVQPFTNATGTVIKHGLTKKADIRNRRNAKAWSHAEIESAARVARQILDQHNHHLMKALNLELSASLRINQDLLQEKDFLLKEVNHRVRNSLQMVSSFLRLQARDARDESLQRGLSEAQRRLNAVALVHRRLYQDSSVEFVDLGRYVESLLDDMMASMDGAWKEQLELELASASVSGDKAVNIGLILTELIINAQKYAYGGEPGPVLVKIEQEADQLRLSVSDRGESKGQSPSPAVLDSTGFGTKLIHALTDRIGGKMIVQDNDPGMLVTVIIPHHVVG